VTSYSQLKSELISDAVPTTELKATASDLPTSGNKIGDQAFVSETNRLYMWNGSGWYNIALINTSPNITSSHDSSYTLSYGTPLNISVDAEDPEGLPLVYDFSTSDSIGNAATITNDSSQFTITPSSDYAEEGTFGLVFTASDGVNLATSGTSNFTLFNNPPTQPTGASPSYVLSNTGNTTSITLASTDPEGQPITYVATTDSGFDAIGTVSVDSSVVTITPKNQAQAPAGGSGTVTFTANDGVKNSSGFNSSFTLQFATGYEDTKYTRMLLTGYDTHDNDNHTNNSAGSSLYQPTTQSGHFPEQGTFTPYRRGGYSTEFMGSGAFIELPSNSNLGPGTGDFTLEFWIYIETTIPAFTKICTGLSSSLTIETQSTNNKLWVTNYGGTILESNTALSPHTWHHFAAVRSSGTLTIYLDGTNDGSTSNSTNFGQIDYIGGSGSNQSFTGLISDFRFVKGTAIIPASGGPTGRLTAVTNTKLLTCHLPYIADGSGTITNDVMLEGVTNDVRTVPRGPYDESTEWDPSIEGGSIMFANTNYAKPNLKFNASSSNSWANMPWQANHASDNWTMEYWIWPDRVLYNPTGFAYGENYDVTVFGMETGVFWLGLKAGSNASDRKGQVTLIYENSGGVAQEVFSDSTYGVVKEKMWSHVVVTRNSSNEIWMAVNGVWSRGKNANGSNHVVSSMSAATGIYYFGNSGFTFGNKVQGYICDFRITSKWWNTNGGRSLSAAAAIPYATNSSFTPPTSPLDGTNSQVLLSGRDFGFIDKTGAHVLSGFGNDGIPKGDSTIAKFSNTKSIRFESNSSNHPIIQIQSQGQYDSTNNLNAGTTSGNYVGHTFDLSAPYWTFEGWFIEYEQDQTYNLIMCEWTHNDTTKQAWAFSSNPQYGSGNKLAFRYWNTSGTDSGWYAPGATNSITTDTWYHAAWVNDNGTLKIFLDGVLQGSTSLNGTIRTTNTPISIGATNYYPYYYRFKGNMQDVRMTIGKARYTSAFTPPTLPLKG